MYYGVPNLVGSENLLSSFGTWWVGDAIGVMIFTPLIIILTAPPTLVSIQRKLSVALPLILLAAVVVSAFAYAETAEKKSIQQDIERKLDDRQQNLSQSLDNLSMYLHAIDTFYQSSDFVSRSEFHTFVKYIMADHEHVVALGWAPRVSADERGNYELKAKTDGLKDFQIFEVNSDHKQVRANGRPYYFPSYYLESYETVTNIGFDLNSDPIRRRFMEQAVALNKLVMTPRVHLISDPDGAYAVLFYQPVYSTGQSLDTILQRQAALKGYVIAAIRVSATIKAALGNIDVDGLRVRVDDISDPADQQLLFDSDKEADAASFGPIVARTTISVGGRTWQLTCGALPSVLVRSSWNLWCILIGGAVFTGLLGALLLIVTGRNDVVLRLVESRTKDLKKSEERFELASTGANVGIWDSDRVTGILHWSPTMFRIMGFGDEAGLDKLEELRRRTHPEDLHLALEALNVHLQAQSDRPYVVDYRVRQDDDSYIWIQVRGQAIWQDGQPVRVSGTVIDITERKAFEAALRQSKAESMQLLAMIENAPDFIGMADMDGNILYHNDAAKELVGRGDSESLQAMRVTDMHPAWAIKIIEEQAVPTILETGVWRGETAVLHADGREIPVSQIVTLFRNEQGVPVCTTTIMQDITERKATENQLKKSEAALQFQLLANALPQLTWMADETGSIYWYNDRWYEYTGTTYEAMQGWGWQSVHHPDHLESVMIQWQDSIATGKPFEMVFPLKSADGQFRQFLTRVNPVRDGNGQIVKWYGTNTDITAQEIALRDANNFFALIMESIPDLVFVNDQQFKIVKANKAFLDIYPKELRDQIIGTTTIDDFTEAEAQNFLRNDREAFESGQSEAIEVITFPNGKHCHLFTKKVRFHDAAGEPFILGISRDITAMRESEQQRLQLMDKLTESNTELERFAYVASHDMQEPLRMIANFSQLIMEEYSGKLGEEGQVYLNLVGGAATRMQAMVADLLEYARVGSDATRFVTVDANKEFVHMLDNLLHAIREQGARVTSDSLPSFGGNPVQIMRLLQNLVGNGLKYQQAGNTPAVHVSAEDAGEVWKISVRDNGIGMQSKHTNQIFEPFKRLHSWQQYQGTGIGLAVCKKIVENHGGQISVMSEVGVGSTFSFTIPKQVEEAL